MRRAAKWIGGVLGGVVLLLVVLLAGVVGGSATGPGRALIAQLVPKFSGGMVQVSGLSGWLFRDPRIARIEVRDPNGVWLTIDDLALDWSPLRLLSGDVAVQRIAAARVAVARLPASSSSSSSSSSSVGSFSLPVRVHVAALHVGQLDLAAPVAGQAVALSVDGTAAVEALDQATATLALHRLDGPGTCSSHYGERPAIILPLPSGEVGARSAPGEGLAANPMDCTCRAPSPAASPRPTGTSPGAGFLPKGEVSSQRDAGHNENDCPGTYTLDATYDPAGIHATLHLAEPAGGLIGSLAALPAIGAINADATLAGPLTAVVTSVTLTAGQLQAQVTGQVDATARTADLAVSAQAPAMAPNPNLSWHAISLRGRVHGAFTKPDASATLLADGLRLGQAAIASVSADLTGNAGQLALSGALNGIRLPGPQPDVLAAAPLRVTATMRLDAANRPATFALTHPLFSIDGTAVTAGDQKVEAHLTIPEVAPLAAAGGIAVAGRVALTLSAARHGADTQVAAQGSIGVSSGPGPSATLLGGDTKLDLLATLHGQSVTVARLSIDSGALSAGMTGSVAPGALDLDWQVALANLATLTPSVSGPFHATGTLSGAADNLTLVANLAGEVSAAGIAPGAVSAQVSLTGLPNAMSGHVDANGMLLGAKLQLAVTAARQDQGFRVAIERADWKSLHADGTLVTVPGALVPQGQVSFAMARLDDLQPLLGPLLGGAALRGGVDGKLESSESGATATITASNAGLAGTATVQRATLDARVSDPVAHPVVDGRLTLDGVAAGGIAGSAQIDAKGPLDALALRLGATSPALAGAPAKLDATATVDTVARTVSIASLQADWKQLPIRLLAPTRISFADGVSVQRLRVGLREAVLEANGRVSPTLDLTARVTAPASLAALVDPTLAFDGTLDAAATLTGTPARPGGTVRVTARGLRAATGPARALPAASLTATATLQGESARLDARASAGTTRLTVTGTAPLSTSGALDLHATGAVDLAVTDPVLTPNGRRARGRASLDVTVTGTPTAPRVNGGAQLADGSFRDFGQGIDIEAINAALTADGGTVRVTRFAAKAGPGTLEASGSLDLTAPNRPIELTLTAHNARPLANDLLTADLDANLTVRGNLMQRLTAAGHVFVRRADIRVPERLPTSVPILNVRIAGTKPPPATPTGAGAPGPAAEPHRHQDSGPAEEASPPPLAGGGWGEGSKRTERRSDTGTNPSPRPPPARGGGGPFSPPPPYPDAHAAGPDIALDLTIDAPEQIFVRGRGLNAELGGEVKLQGSAANPLPSGGFTLRQGDFSLAGQTLTFTTGEVSFNGGSLTDPSLNFTATVTSGDVIATLAITGTASKPKITLSSTPPLPQDEILSYLLYGERTASLGPLQIAQIAATLASLAGAGPTITNPLESLREAAGLDRLTLGSSGLQAGRYIARNVYVGAQQSVTGTGTQAVVQVDLAKGLKLQATAGSSTAQTATGAGGSADAASVGITYQFEY